MADMIGSLAKCRRVPEWERTFLIAIRHGYGEFAAANSCGIGVAIVHARMENDEKFKQNYEETVAKRKARPAGGF